MRNTPVFSSDEKKVLLVSVEIGWFVLATLGRYIKDGELGLNVDKSRKHAKEIKVAVEQIVDGENK